MNFELSETQIQIIRLLVCEGKTPKKISQILNTTPKTVYQRIYEVRSILDLKNTIQLIHRYYTDRHFRRLING